MQEDPLQSIIHGDTAKGTRIIMTLTPYDLCVLTQMLALAAYPDRYTGAQTPAGQDLAVRVGDLIIEHMNKIWEGLTPEERALGQNRVIDYGQE